MAEIEFRTLSRNIIFAFTDSRKIILNITCIKEQNRTDKQLGSCEEHLKKQTAKNKNEIFFPHSNNFAIRSKWFDMKKNILFCDGITIYYARLFS